MDEVTNFGASHESEVKLELVTGQLKPHNVTEFYSLVVSNPVPVKVTVAPPANDTVGVLEVGALAETTNCYLVASLIHAYLLSICKYTV